MAYTILLVDDDKSFREEFRECFEDYRVQEASSGEEALRILQKPNEVDVVILDVVMSGLRGTEVLKRMKRIDPNLGIVILTGYSCKDIAVEALKGRADDYLEKPVDVERTRELLNLLVRNRSTAGTVDDGSIEGKIERVKHFARRNYEKKLCLRDAAEAVCLSPKYLSRVFKEHKGMGFSEYRLAIKMDKAKELLRNTRYNIDQISYMMGYQNVASFTTIFKKMTGQMPTAYRKHNVVRDAGAGKKKE